MNKPARILTAIIGALVLGCIFAYLDIQKYGTDFQAHPMLPVVILTDFFGASLSVMFFYFASRWLYRRKDKKLKESGSGKFYDEVARELEAKSLRPGLWTRAVAETGDEGSAAKALYIRLRVSELVQEEQTDRASLQAEARRKADEQRRAENAAKPWYVVVVVLFGILCGLLTVGGFLGIIGLLIDIFSETPGSDLGGDLAGGFGCVLVAVFFGWATYRSFKQIS